MQRHIHLHIEESHKNAKPEAIICMYLKSWSNGRLALLCHLVPYTLRKLRANMQYYIVTAGEQNTSRLRLDPDIRTMHRKGTLENQSEPESSGKHRF